MAATRQLTSANHWAPVSRPNLASPSPARGPTQGSRKRPTTEKRGGASWLGRIPPSLLAHPAAALPRATVPEDGPRSAVPISALLTLCMTRGRRKRRAMLLPTDAGSYPELLRAGPGAALQPPPCVTSVTGVCVGCGRRRDQGGGGAKSGKPQEADSGGGLRRHTPP